MTDVPEFLSHLPIQGKLLVPWFVWRDKEGRYQFRVRDENKNGEAARFQLCFICGKWIPRPPYSFLLGPETMRLQMTYGGPAHDQCLRAATRLCPYIARQDWERSNPPEELQRVPHDELPPKPERYALVRCSRHWSFKGPTGGWYSQLGAYEIASWWSYKDGVLTEEIG